MIEPNELRIGNYIYQLEDGAIVQIAGVFEESTIHLKGEEKSIFGGRELRAFAPILLDTAILEKCGFKEEGDFSYTHPGKDQIIFAELISRPNYEGLLFQLYVGSGWEYTYGEQLKYLHQLQNLYFALTSEELPVKL
jgi:hypothetical protein